MRSSLAVAVEVGLVRHLQQLSKDTDESRYLEPFFREVDSLAQACEGLLQALRLAARWRVPGVFGEAIRCAEDDRRPTVVVLAQGFKCLDLHSRTTGHRHPAIVSLRSATRDRTFVSGSSWPERSRRRAIRHA